MNSKIPSYLTESNLGMSNCDHLIDDGLDAELAAGTTFATHSAWNFCGYVWFANGLFHEEVWRYGSPIDVVQDTTLDGVMCKVNDLYGSD